MLCGSCTSVFDLSKPHDTEFFIFIFHQQLWLIPESKKTFWSGNVFNPWADTTHPQNRKRMFIQWCKNMNWCYKILLSFLVSKNSDNCVCFDLCCVQGAAVSDPHLLNISAGDKVWLLTHCSQQRDFSPTPQKHRVHYTTARFHVFFDAQINCITGFLLPTWGRY